ncbi:MAG: flagellar biosynthesis anti-sigma factor FlgM [Treponemataceae bacterium]|nr:flagellar biosynthesis anti-sigma factor FlgM [Treponemataceae bacterium]
MMIDRLGGINPLDSIKSTQKATAKSTVKNSSDTVSISEEAREMAEVYYLSEVAKETPDVRADLVAEIKAKISDPSYMNSAVIESTADKILSSFGF